jgi:Sec-independent protein translocase protein TatA
MEAHEMPGIVQELSTAIAGFHETATQKHDELQIRKEDLEQAQQELDGASSEWDNVLQTLSSFNPERLTEAIEEAERLLGDN